MIGIEELILQGLKYEKGHAIKIKWKDTSIELRFLPLEFLLPNGSPGVYYTPGNLIAIYKKYRFHACPEKNLSALIFAHELGHAFFHSLMNQDESVLYRYWIFSPIQEVIAWALGLSWLSDIKKVLFEELKDEYKDFIIYCLGKFGKKYAEIAFDRLHYLYINDIMNSLKDFNELAYFFTGK